MENNVLEKEFQTLCQQVIFEAQKCTIKTRSSEINEHRGPNNDIRHPGHQTSRTSDIRDIRHPGHQTSRTSDIQDIRHPGQFFQSHFWAKNYLSWMSDVLDV